MARKKSFRPAIAPVETVDELRKGVENELNRLSTQLGSQDFFADTSANTYRLSRLGNPAAEHDAVNLSTMRKGIDKAIEELYAKLHRPNLNKAWGFDDIEFVITPSGLQILGLDMTKSFNFDTDIFGNEIDFTVLAGGIGTDEIAAGAVNTLKLTTQEINVGYSGNDMPVRFRVWDTNNVGIAWIGDDSINHGGDTDYVGAWFKRILIGGDGTLGNAGFFADAFGNVAARSLFIKNTDDLTGWIGTRTTTGGSPVTFDGGWFKELYVGGTWIDANDSGPNNSPFTVNSSGDLSIQFDDITTTQVDINKTDFIKVSNIAGSTTNQMLNSGFKTEAATSARFTTSSVGLDFDEYYSGAFRNRVGIGVNSGTKESEVVLKNRSGTSTVGLYHDETNAYGFVISQEYYIGLSLVIDSNKNLENINNLELGGYIKMDGVYTIVDTNRNIDNIVNLNITGEYKMDGGTLINTDGNLLGGVVSTTSALGGTAHNVYQSGWYFGVTGPTTFTTVDGKTVTVRGGIITSIV